MRPIITAEGIGHKISLVRGHKVMLDADLAERHGVLTKVLVRSVKRNIRRFPADFMFQLTDQEAIDSRSQSVTSSSERGGRRYSPLRFHRAGVAMLSSVLNSERAIDVNIQIMRVFAKLRKMIASHKDLARRLDEMEQRYGAQFKVVFDAIRLLIATPEPKEKKIGFICEEQATDRAAAGVSA